MANSIKRHLSTVMNTIHQVWCCFQIIPILISIVYKLENKQFRIRVYTELFEVFLAAAGSSAKYKQDLKCAQLKIAYSILFYVGLRVNEIRFFQEKDIQNAIKTSQFSVVHFKQREPHIRVISDLAVKELKN